jgi:hypothetical protein
LSALANVNTTPKYRHVAIATHLESIDPVAAAGDARLGAVDAGLQSRKRGFFARLACCQQLELLL